MTDECPPEGKQKTLLYMRPATLFFFRVFRVVHS